MASTLQDLCCNVIVEEFGWPNSQKKSTVVRYKELFEELGMPTPLVKAMIAKLFGEKVWKRYCLSGSESGDDE